MVTILLFLFPNGEVNPLDYNSKIHTTGCHQLQIDTLLTDGRTDERTDAPTRAGVKYVLSNTTTNTKILIFQIQIQIFCSILIQIQIQIYGFKYKYKYVQPVYLPKLFRSKGNSMNPKIYANGLCFLIYRLHLKLTPLHFRKFHWH